LFPGYCFARFFIEECLSVVKARGVVKVIGTDHRPEPIPDEEIQNIQQLMTHSLPYDSHPYIKEGTRVRIIRGPLEGLEGILSRKDKHSRVIISIHLIQQSTAVEIDMGDIVPV
jgi:transcription antitermination factor NusG